MKRTPIRILAAAIVVALCVFLTRSSDDRAPRAAALVETTLSNDAPHACDVLTRKIAKDYLGRLRGEPRDNRGSSGETCTYLSPSLNRSVGVGIYPASEYPAAVKIMSTPRRERVAGRPTTFNSRFGYLIRLRDRPYYLQVSFQHATHLHANRRRSRRLAQTILVGAPAPTGPFICPIYGKRVV